MRKWISKELQPVRELVELYENGLLVVDVLREGDAQPAFRTVVQIDGDVLSIIGAGAVKDPNFAEAYARHIEHVGARLRALTDRPRRWARRFSAVVSGVWTGLVAVGMRGSGTATQIVGEAWDEVYSAACGFLVGVVVWPLGRRLLRRVVAWGLEEERRARALAALARLGGDRSS
jgi:hypothetical protein